MTEFFNVGLWLTQVRFWVTLLAGGMGKKPGYLLPEVMSLRQVWVEEEVLRTCAYMKARFLLRTLALLCHLGICIYYLAFSGCCRVP
jgi:hypothetical protein